MHNSKNGRLTGVDYYLAIIDRANLWSEVDEEDEETWETIDSPWTDLGGEG